MDIDTMITKAMADWDEYHNAMMNEWLKALDKVSELQTSFPIEDRSGDVSASDVPSTIVERPTNGNFSAGNVNPFWQIDFGFRGDCPKGGDHEVAKYVGFSHVKDYCKKCGKDL